MKVAFVHRGNDGMASYKMRAAMPVEQLRAMGHEAYLNDGEGEVFVFSKPLWKEDYELALQIKTAGAKVVVDIADYHYAKYSNVIQLADRVVTPTAKFRQRVLDDLRIDSVMIPEPYVQPELAPHADGGERILWFGSHVNLKDLDEVLPRLAGLDFHVVSAPNNRMHVTPWTPKNMTEELRRANLCIFPSRDNVEEKSAHRMVNAIRAGCFCVSDPHPAYDEFSDWMFTSGVLAGLDWCRKNRDSLNERVAKAQEYVRDRYSPQVVGKCWENLLRDTLGD